MNNNKTYVYGRTSTYRLNYHIAWTTNNKESILSNDLVDELKAELLSIADEYGFEIIKIKVTDKTVINVFVASVPKLSVTDIVKCLKGITAKKMLLEFEQFQTEYWQQKGRHLWSNSYYVESLGELNKQELNKYIE